VANNPHVLEAARNTALDTITTTISTSAVFVMYAGTQPANVNAATTAANTVCASLAFPSTNAFGAAASGVLTANTITADATAAGGTVAWFSVQKATGLRVLDGSAGTASADLILNAVTITTNANVAVSTFTVTIAA
jgi:hypothetical protein